MTKPISKIEKLIAELCPGGVEFRALGEVVDILRGKRLTKNLLSDNEKYPVYHGGLEPLGHYGQSNRIANTVMVINVGASAGTVGYSSVDFWSSDGCFCIGNSDLLISRFIYYALLCHENILRSKVRFAGIPTLDATAVERIQIPIPPLAIQREIVKMLDTFTELDTELDAELEARKKQYEYYREELLKFGDDVERKSLGDVCFKTENIKWKENQEVDYQYIDLSSVSRENNKITETQTINSTNAPSRAQQIIKKDDVIFGTTRPTLKRYSLIDSKYDNQICSTGFCVLRANQEVVLPRFLFFILKTMNFYCFVESNQEGAGYPSISNSKVKEFPSPIPPLAEQERIIAILDKFDALANDISVGLPAELNARRKQYEYYRRKLLTFKPLEKEYAAK